MTHAFDDAIQEPELDAATVLERIRDWERRVADLIAAIETWSEDAGLTAMPGEPAMMREELMATFHIPDLALPTLTINRRGEFLAKAVPYGLWIIGGNGRVDLKTRFGVHMMIDVASAFSAPDWRIAGPGMRNAPRLTSASFNAALAA